eukprot:1907813-Lingulodinium_polyedra.AAC.1
MAFAPGRGPGCVARPRWSCGVAGPRRVLLPGRPWFGRAPPALGRRAPLAYSWQFSPAQRPRS